MATGRFKRLVLGAGLTGTDNADDSITIDASAAGGVASDTIWNAKGDLAVASAADTAARLAVGADGLVLTADSGETLGVKWDTAGATPALTLLSDTTLGSNGSIDVSSISGSYNDLVLVLLGRISTAAASENVKLVLNNDTGSNYYTERIRGTGTTVAATELLTQASFQNATVPAANASADLFGYIQWTLPGYASTTWKKAMFGDVAYATALSTGNLFVASVSGYWDSTAAVNRVTLNGTTGNLVTGSQLRIYGRL